MWYWNEYAQKYYSYCQFQKKLTSNTIRGYQFDLQYFFKFLEGYDNSIHCFDDITRHVLEDYLESLTPIYRVKTVKRKMAGLKGFFTYLERHELISENPFRNLQIRLREEYRRPKGLSMSEISKLLHVVYKSEIALEAQAKWKSSKHNGLGIRNLTVDEFLWYRDAAILELLFATGVRVTELCSIRYEDYDESENSLTIIGKGNRERKTFVENKQVLSILGDYLTIRKSVPFYCESIFITKFFDSMSTQAVRLVVEKYTTLAGFTKRITPHSFRHTFASLMLEQGVDIRYIQELLGHTSITTTQIYLHVSEDKIKNIIATQHPRERMSTTL